MPPGVRRVRRATILQATTRERELHAPRRFRVRLCRRSRNPLPGAPGDGRRADVEEPPPVALLPRDLPPPPLALRRDHPAEALRLSRDGRLLRRAGRRQAVHLPGTASDRRPGGLAAAP